MNKQAQCRNFGFAKEVNIRLQNSLNDFLYERVSAVENSLVQATEYQIVKKATMINVLALRQH